MQHETILITGAGGGIGLATVNALLEDEAVRVIAVARDAGHRLSDAVHRHGSDRLRPIDADLSSPDAIERIASAIGPGRLTGLIHNAGVLDRTAMGAHQRARILEVFDINAAVPLLLTQALADRLAGDPPGHVLHISSMGGFQDSAKFPGLVAYSASKAALACMAQCLAEEFKDRGIRSNALALGAVDTGMLRAAFPGYQAPVSAMEMGRFVAWFVRQGYKSFNGKVLPVSLSSP
ncbi:MAG: SDR family oxidoreductase [Flavobacteriales bacterium]|nr:MAG: SDR family oxidoreductase [Flavobacteriales bacterium]